MEGDRESTHSLGKQAVASPGLREYVDEAESGRVMNRPEFRRMIDEARKTKPLSTRYSLRVWGSSR